MRAPFEYSVRTNVTEPGAAPVLAIVGTADPYTPPDAVDALEATGAEVHRYEGAEHGFELQRKTLVQNQGGGEDNLVETFTLTQAEIGDVNTTWTLNVADTEAQDTGTVNKVADGTMHPDLFAVKV